MDRETKRTCCAVCNLQSNRRCSRCLNVYYCNQEHQRQDWRRHRLECGPKLPKQGLPSKKSGSHKTVIEETSNKKDKEQLSSVLDLSQRNFPIQSSKKAGSEINEAVRTTVIKSTKKETVEQESVGDSEQSKISVKNFVNIRNLNVDKQLLNNSQNSLTNNVHINRGVIEHSAITQEGSSEQKILSEPAQKLDAMNYIGGTQVSNRLDSMPSQASTVGQQRLRDYPETVTRAGPSGTLNLNADPRVYDVCRTLIADMNEYGVCLLQNFYGKEKGLKVRNEVLNLYKSGIFTAGEVVSNPGNSRTQAIRSDLTTWVDGSEPYCTNIQQLMSFIDRIVITANKMAGNGKLGDYDINGRTKAMVACYPGSGTHYVKHYDNPHKDGRCITAIYYLNLDWDAERSGGVLKVFPEGLDIECNVEPQFDNMLFFWSDLRNPHEVQPAYDTRYAVTLWYFDNKERTEARKRYSGK